MKVLVIAGGVSSEREVSLRSGAAVHQALIEAGYDAELYDLTGREIIIDLKTYDIVFPALHGNFGEDGEIQKLLDDAGAVYVGSDVTSSALCFDKSMHKTLLRKSDILTPDWSLTHDFDIKDNPLVSRPFVLKPYDGGSSVDNFIIRDPATADWPAILETCAKYGEMLLEELITGTEITVGVLDDQPLPVVEIIPPANGEFDYENKYNGQTQELCPAVSIIAEKQAEAQALALRIHQLSGCRDLSRTDMIVTADGELYVLETNTLPGMTNQSLFPKAAATAGISMTELCDRLVQAAASR